MRGFPSAYQSNNETVLKTALFLCKPSHYGEVVENKNHLFSVATSYLNRSKRSFTMKFSTLTSIALILFSCSIDTYATEYKFVAQDNAKATQICMAAVTDNTQVLRSKIQRLTFESTRSFRSIVNSILCNNQYVGHFAKTYNAQNTFAYLDKYTNKRNKKLESKVTINDIAYETGLDKQKTIIVLVATK